MLTAAAAVAGAWRGYDSFHDAAVMGEGGVLLPAWELRRRRTWSSLAQGVAALETLLNTRAPSAR